MRTQYEVKFDKKNHAYTVNGEVAVSVTRILQAIGIQEKFEDLPEYIMERVRQARDRGNYYDQLGEELTKEMKETNDLEEMLVNEWQTKLFEKLIEIGFKKPDAQTPLGTLEPFAMAGMPDFIERGEVVIKNVIYEAIIADLKATGVIKINAVTWQTNYYAFLDDPENYEKYAKFVIHFDEKYERFTVIQLKTIPREILLKGLEAYIMGEQFDQQFEIVDTIKLNELLTDVEEIEEKLKEAKEKLEEYKGEMMTNLKENNIKTTENSLFKITYTPATTRQSFDTEAFYKSKGIELPKPTKEEEEEFKKVTAQVKERITITRKK